MIMRSIAHERVVVKGIDEPQTFGDHACHPERSEGEGSGSTGGEILRCAQDDSQDTTQVRSSLLSKRLDEPPVCILRCSLRISHLKLMKAMLLHAL